MERDLESTLMKGKQLPPPRPHARYCRETSKSHKKSFKVEALSQLQQAEPCTLSGLPFPAPNPGPAYSFPGWDKSLLRGETKALTQPLLLSGSGCTAGRWDKSPMSISGCISSQGQQKGTAGPGRTLDVKVSSDPNLKRHWLRGPATLKYTLLLPLFCSRTPKLPAHA